MCNCMKYCIWCLAFILGCLAALIMGCTACLDVYYPTKAEAQQRQMVHDRNQGVSADNLALFEAYWSDQKDKGVY